MVRFYRLSIVTSCLAAVCKYLGEVPEVYVISEDMFVRNYVHIFYLLGAGRYD